MKTTTCPICKDIFRTPQGLRGHLNFKHGMCKQTSKVKQIAENIRRSKQYLDVTIPNIKEWFKFEELSPSPKVDYNPVTMHKNYERIKGFIWK